VVRDGPDGPCRVEEDAIDPETLVHASSLAELCWLAPDGTPRVRGVVPLVLEGRPVVAFLYADQAVAREAAASPRVALVTAEPRSTGTAFVPTVLQGRPSLREDPEGDLYVSDLVVQELRRFPPARVFADSPLLMREHWWYLPRLVLAVDVEAAAPTTAREAPYDHLLAVAHDGTLAVRAAGPVGEPGPEGSTAELVVDGTPPPPGPAVLFGQDASFPDLERWSQWRWRGHWDGERLTVSEAPASTGLGGPPGLVQRWRRQRDLERRCTAAIPRPGRT
jgi:hypothetical protein